MILERWKGKRYYVLLKSAACSSCPADLAWPRRCIAQPEESIFRKQRALAAAPSPGQHRLTGRRAAKDMSRHFSIFCSIFKRTAHQKADKIGLLSGIGRGCNHQSSTPPSAHGSASFSSCAVPRPTGTHRQPPQPAARPQPGKPQQGLSLINDWFRQTKLPNRGTVSWRLKSK